MDHATRDWRSGTSSCQRKPVSSTSWFGRHATSPAQGPRRACRARGSLYVQAVVLDANDDDLQLPYKCVNNLYRRCVTISIAAPYRCQSIQYNNIKFYINFLQSWNCVLYYVATDDMGKHCLRLYTNVENKNFKFQVLLFKTCAAPPATVWPQPPHISLILCWILFSVF